MAPKKMIAPLDAIRRYIIVNNQLDVVQFCTTSSVVLIVIQWLNSYLTVLLCQWWRLWRTNSLSDVMVVPEVLPDETVPSFLARLVRLNGYLDARDVLLPNYQKTPWVSVIDSPFRLPEFCEWIKEALGKPRQLLMNHTNLHGASLLREISDEQFRRFVMGKESITLAELGGLQSPCFKFCRTCVESDIRKYGQSYWHRIHQPNFVSVCHVHGDVLVKAKVKRAVLHHRLPLPGELMFGPHYVEMAASGPQVVNSEIASFICDLLSPKQISSASIESAMFDDLRARGFMTPLGRVHIKELSGFLLRKLEASNLYVDKHERDFAVQKAVTSILEPTSGRGLHRALLLSHLFGNWESLQEKSTWLDVIGIQKEGADDPHAKGLRRDLRELHMTRCLNYIDSVPVPTRIGFTRADYRSFRWLKSNEPDWLESRLPKPKSKQLKLTLV